jgi:ATP-dependent protease ClpP protease subunit
VQFDLYVPEPRVPVPDLAGRCYVRVWNHIDRDMVDRVAETLARAPSAEHLTIDVDSYGGEFTAAFDIFVLLDRHPAMRKVSFGANIKSAALLPFLAGDERIARGGASLLIHPVVGGHPEDRPWLNDQFAKIITARTGAPLDIISREQETEEPSTLDWCVQNKIFTRTLN